MVGRIADRGAEYVSAREWMRICFELLELLKAHKKAIRRATVNTFGYIAKAIGYVFFNQSCEMNYNHWKDTLFSETCLKRPLKGEGNGGLLINVQITSNALEMKLKINVL